MKANRDRTAQLAVHAAGALALLPVEVGPIRAVGYVHARLLGDKRSSWVLPTALLLAATGTVFVWTLTRQL